MAKGIEINGQLRGKRGGIVYYRSGGQQISRARNFNPNNPKTVKQLYQRAIMATVMLAYSAGAKIFDHAFQGKKVGQQNMSRFLSLNAKLLRAYIAAYIESGTDNLVRVIGPGVSSAVPNLYQVSEGSYDNTQLDHNGTLKVTPTVGETIAAYAARAGLIEGDIFTYVVLNCGGLTLFTAPGATVDHGRCFQCAFEYAQVKVKAGVTTDTTEITADTTFASLFEESDMTISEIQLDAKITRENATLFATGDVELYGLGKATNAVIRSREDEDLRSTTFMEAAGPNEGEYGLRPDWLLAAWQAGTDNLGSSELILEGANF